jgi:hypothetical protein
MKRRACGSGGFLLIEMIATIVLLTAFALIAAKLFHETMIVIEQAPAEHDALIRFESCCLTLRHDAWGASAFSDGGANGVSISVPNQSGIRWRITAGGDIERIQGIELRRWLGVGADAEFQADGLCIVLRSNKTKADRDDEVRFVSLLQIADTLGKTK